MFFMKRLLSVLLAIIMSLSLFTIPVSAVDVPEESIVATVSVFDSDIECKEYFDALDEEAVSSSVESAVFAVALVRKNGASDETCQVYMNWSGNTLIGSIRFKKLVIKSTSFLFPETYETFGDGTSYSTYNVTSSTSGTLFLGDAEIPTDVDKVKVSVKDFQAYYMSHAKWVSGDETTATVEITD